jgi:hypothetical protein
MVRGAAAVGAYRVASRSAGGRFGRIASRSRHCLLAAQIDDGSKQRLSLRRISAAALLFEPARLQRARLPAEANTPNQFSRLGSP